MLKQIKIVVYSDGREKMYTGDDGIVIVPYGIRGLFNEYKYFDKNLHGIDIKERSTFRYQIGVDIPVHPNLTSNP